MSIRPTEACSGELFEASGRSEDGWVVMAVFDSKERWDTSFSEKLMPIMGEIGDRASIERLRAVTAGD